MALLVNKQQYLERMNSAAEHKYKMIDLVKGPRVLDYGCGTGLLASEIKNRFPSYDVVGYDSSPDMIEASQEYGNPAVNFTALYPSKGNFNTIILSGVLHEVYSYEQGLYSVIKTLNALEELLAPNGKIIIREAHAIDDSYPEIEAIPKDPEDAYNFFKQFERYFEWETDNDYTFDSNDSPPLKFFGKNDLLEFANKYTWGWESLVREIKEKVYFATPDLWVKILSKLPFNKVTITKVTQDDYYEHLEKKLHLSYRPPTHVIVEYEKE